LDRYFGGNLVLSGQLVPTKAEPPKRGTAEDTGNPNDGSSTSDWTASNSSGSTNMTSIRVPRRVRERVEAVAPQLYEQDRLSELCEQSFSTLSEACSVSRATGVIDDADRERLRDWGGAWAALHHLSERPMRSHKPSRLMLLQQMRF
jgi:hypothetical protein